MFFGELAAGGDGKGLPNGEKDRFTWLKTLYLPPKVWEELDWHGEDKGPDPLVPDELCIERVGIEQFVSLPIERRSVAIERTDVKASSKAAPSYKIGPAPLEPEESPATDQKGEGG